MSAYVAKSVGEAASLLEIARATLSTWLNKQDRRDLWEETPGGRKKFTAEHIAKIHAAYFGSDADSNLQYFKAHQRLNPPKEYSAVGWVYFGVSNMTGFVKIGFSKDPEARLNDLRNKTGLSTELVRKISGDVGVEQEFHKRFAEYRIEGEWFKKEGKLKEFLQKP